MSIDIKSKLITEFSKFENRLNGQKNTKIHSIRKKSFNSFVKLSQPTKKNEDWKFTNLNFLNEIDFNFNKNDSDLSEKDIASFIIPDLNENLIVFVNGVYSEKLSKIRYPREEIIIESFHKADLRNAPNLNKHFAKYSDYNKDFFTAMNTAFASDGIYVNVPNGVTIPEPIHVLFISDTRQGPVMSNPRNLFIMGQCSELKILETYHTIGDNPAFTNMVTEIVSGFSSNFQFNKIQNDKGNSYYIGTTQIEQAKNSVLTSSTISLSGKFIRNNLNTVFAEESAEAHLNGFYYISDENYVNNHTFIDHAVPRCNSREFYKGILDDKSRAVFNGSVLVRPDAQQTNSFQSNKNILLTDDARINSKPELVINADDVKCSHGATTGYLNKESMFYLRSRGLSEEMAKSLLLNAFASEIIETIGISAIRNDIKRQVSERLAVDDIYFCDVLDEIKTDDL